MGYMNFNLPGQSLDALNPAEKTEKGRLRELTILMAGRLRYYKKARVGARAVQCLMRLTRRYLQPLPRLKDIESPRDLHRELASQHIEELPRAGVEVTLLFGTGRHTLLDHAEVFAPQEIPAIADSAPGVVIFVRRTN